MSRAHYALVSIALVWMVPAIAHASYPRGPAVARVESPTAGPVQVCSEILQAEKDGRVDDLVSHTSTYARERFSNWDRFLLHLARGRLSEARCVRVVQKPDANHAMVFVYAPQGHGAAMPFVRQRGVWRFDQKRWEQLRSEGKAPHA